MDQLRQVVGIAALVAAFALGVALAVFYCAGEYTAGRFVRECWPAGLILLALAAVSRLLLEGRR